MGRLIPLEIKKIEGIIVGEKSFGESSKILDLITKEYGVISLLSKGSKRLKSTLRSVSQMFTYAEFEISYKKDKLSTLISADIIDNLYNIKSDIYCSFAIWSIWINFIKCICQYCDFIICVYKFKIV